MVGACLGEVAGRIESLLDRDVGLSKDLTTLVLVSAPVAGVGGEANLADALPGFKGKRGSRTGSYARSRGR